MVYPQFPDTFWSFKHALKFVNRKNNNPPLGLLTISSMLPQDWQRKLVDLNIQRLKDSDIQWADLVFISAMDVQRTSVHEILPRLKQFGKYIVAGGPLFTGEHDQFPLIDTFVLNEGELPFLDFWLILLLAINCIKFMKPLIMRIFDPVHCLIFQ